MPVRKVMLPVAVVLFLSVMIHCQSQLPSASNEEPIIHVKNHAQATLFFVRSTDDDFGDAIGTAAAETTTTFHVPIGTRYYCSGYVQGKGCGDYSGNFAQPLEPGDEETVYINY